RRACPFRTRDSGLQRSGLLPCHHMEHMPVLRLAERRLSVLLDFTEHLDLERGQHSLHLAPRVIGPCHALPPPRPRGVPAKELPREAPPRPYAPRDPLPQPRKVRRGAVGDREARIHQVAPRPLGILVPRDDRSESPTRFPRHTPL